jgi:hypothetical protein
MNKSVSLADCGGRDRPAQFPATFELDFLRAAKMQLIKENAMYRTLNTKRFVIPQSQFSPGPAPFLE